MEAQSNLKQVKPTQTPLKRLRRVKAGVSLTMTFHCKWNIFCVRTCLVQIITRFSLVGFNNNNG